MRQKSLIVLVSLGMLAGCQSEKSATGKTLADLQAQCTAYGFTPGTDVYAACVYQSDQNRIAQNRAARLRFAGAMQRIGQNMQAQAAANRPRTCYTNQMGSTLTTQCY